MKVLTLSLLLMTTNAAMAQKATTTKKTFSRETTVNVLIDADSATVWSLLTNASDYTRWNSTIVSLEGTIQEGEKILLRSTLDVNRKFRLKVKECAPMHRLVWGDGKGSRVFTVTQHGDQISFTMSEKIGGIMFPLYAKYIPPFDASFEQFAADLKQEAERIFTTK